MRKLLLLVLLALPVIAQAQDHPVFFNDATSLARYAAMKANYDANPSAPSNLGGKIYKFVKTQADAGNRYSDIGQWAAYMYHWGGGAGYAAQSWTKLAPFINKTDVTCGNSGLGGNYIREFGWQYVLIYDWIYPALDAGQRTAMLDKINLMVGCIAAGGRTADSDQTIGEYMTAAMWFQSTGDYNSTAATIWNDPARLIGGWDVTVATLGGTRRNAIAYYIETMAAGGEFLESTEYNLNTLKLIVIPNAALKSAGITKLPEVDSWIDDAALSFIHVLTPGAGAGTVVAYQRADNQQDSLLTYYRLETCFALAGEGAAKGTSAGPYIQDFCMDYVGSNSLDTLDPYPRGFLLFDSAATRGDLSTLDRDRFNSGVGLYTVRSGWTPSDSAFFAHMQGNPFYVDHVPAIWGEFQLWKNGKWAIRHPIGYGGPSFDSRGTNSLQIEGLPYSPGATYGSREYRSIREHWSDWTNSFHYLTGTIGGSIAQSGSYHPAQTSLHEYTRSLVYLSGLDVIVVYDRANSDDFVTTGTGTNAALATWINSRPRTTLYVHSPVAATLGAGTISWDYASGEGVKVSTLVPSNPTRTQEGPITGQVGFLYQTRITPSNDPQKWTKFLNVWDAYGSGTPATVSLVQDTTNQVDAALITKGSQSILTSFNAIQGPDVPLLTFSGGFGYWQTGIDAILNKVRLRSSDFSLTWTSAVPTKVLLFDMDHLATWTYTVNGGAPESLAIDDDDGGIIDIATTGEITLAVTGEGGIPAPVVVETTEVPDCVVGVAYSEEIAASGGDDGPYTCTLDSGTLPDGLSLNAACATGITGTPSAVDSANSLTKTAATAWGNAGAYSTNSLASGDGYVETKIAETTTYRMFGLSVGNTNNNYTDIDYGLDIVNPGWALVYEGGVLKYQTTNNFYATGDLLRVAVVNGAVEYSKNGTVFYTSLTAPSYPLLVDTALYTQGATLKNVVGDFGAGAVDVAWAAITGASSGGGSSRTFAIEVCDDTPTCATQSYTMNILSMPTITTTSLDPCVIGTPYDETVVVGGGNDPFAWSLVSEADLLPPGLSFAAGTTSTKHITGDCTTVGAYQFNVRVTDDDETYDDQLLGITVVSALAQLTVTITPGSTSAVVQYGSTNAQDDCVVNLLDGETILDTVTSTGPSTSSRTASFGGLTPLTPYTVDVTCESAEVNRSFFSTLEAPPTAQALDWIYKLKPSARLLARGVTNALVSYNLIGEAADTVNAACETDCILTLPLISGETYQLHHVWRNSGDATVATGRVGTVAVP